jgi:hypothetical protein
MADLGWLKVGDDGKWRWPFATLHPGDYFKVEPTDRTVGQVRNLANSAGTRLGCRFSVTTDSDGAALVRRTSVQEDERRIAALGWDTFAKLMKKLYRREMEEIAWFAIDDVLEIAAPQWGGEEKRKILVSADSRRFVISLYFDGFRIERVRDGLTLVEWIELQEKCEELFGPCEKQGALLFSADGDESTRT